MGKWFFILISASLCFANDCRTQPLLDIVNIRYQVSPDAGAFRQNFVQNYIRYWNISTNLPVEFKNKKSILLASPGFEEWKFSFPKKEATDALVKGWTLPLLWIQTLNPRWTITTGVIIRNNAEDFNLNKAWQVGGVALATYEKSKQLKYKFGLYYNSELSGPFFMPLLGIDWRTNKTNIYGVLPGNLTIERKLNTVFYYGITFRAITNSYQLYNNKFIRIDDNQLALYMDCYLSKHIVLNVEAGHSFFRRIRLGENQKHSVYYFTAKTNDNLLLKTGLAYRLRL
jgi:hypothetical protein